MHYIFFGCNVGNNIHSAPLHLASVVLFILTEPLVLCCELEGEMSMIASSSSHSDPDSRSLQALLEAFGSRFSLDDIAAAYSQASQNVDMACEILFAMTEEKTPQTDKDKMDGATSKPAHVYVPKEVRGQEEGKAKVWRPKRNSTSVGTVSSFIGKEYVRTRPITNAPREATKPMKIDSKDIPETEIWSEEMPKSKEANISRAPTDVEEFIVKMLGEGFQASPEVIHQILGKSILYFLSPY